MASLHEGRNEDSMTAALCVDIKEDCPASTLHSRRLLCMEADNRLPCTGVTLKEGCPAWRLHKGCPA
eukprot:366350-Chlamydomonas_euryale.AAC.3